MPQRNRLGEIFVKARLVTADQLKEALLVQQGNARFLGQILVEKGWCAEPDVVQAIAAALRRRAVNIKDVLISQKIVQLVPKALAAKYHILPLFIQNTTLFLAMENPLDIDVIQQIEFSTGKQVMPLVAPSSQLRDAVRRHYTITEYVGNMLDHMTQDDELTVDKAPGTSQKGAGLRKVAREDGGDNEIVKLTNVILAEGIKARASDIHIEPGAQQLHVRYRIDGLLTGGIKLPKEVYPPLLSRLKVLAGMDMTEHNASQDGHFRLTYSQRKVDFRVSTMLTSFGEKMVLRILNKDAKFYDLSRLGLSAAQLRQYQALLQQSQGLLLATGPTGSGKTTTLYALLNVLKGGTKHILTIEDPIEYQLEGITQMQANAKLGLTFVSGLRSMLRQDPDVILVGEIRDAETASVAIQAAETGHLVLSTLQTTDAAATVNRFLTLGIAAELVASNLLAAVAQRLVRRICPRCRQAAAPSAQELASLGLPGAPAGWTFAKGAGCRACKQTGYYGQIGIYELFAPHERLRQEIAQRATKQELKRLAVAAGMQTMLENGLDLVRQGITTAEEVIRVCYIEQADLESPGPDPEDRKTLVLVEEIEPAPPVAASPLCQQCGRELDKAWTVCPFCGKRTAQAPEVLAPPALPAPKSPPPPENAKNERIVVAEDTTDTRKMLQFLLQRKGYQVSLAADGEEALKKIFSERPDIVILDINMPKRNGFEVCQEMRANMDTAFIPVILLTADDSIEGKIQGLSLGADDYITKPFHPDELLARVDAVLRRAGQQAK